MIKTLFRITGQSLTWITFQETRERPFHQRSQPHVVCPPNFIYLSVERIIQRNLLCSLLFTLSILHVINHHQHFSYHLISVQRSILLISSSWSRDLRLHSAWKALPCNGQLLYISPTVFFFVFIANFHFHNLETWAWNSARLCRRPSFF